MPAELKTETGGKHFLPGRGLGMNHSMLFDFFFNRCVYNFGLLKKTDFLRERTVRIPIHCTLPASASALPWQAPSTPGPPEPVWEGR